MNASAFFLAALASGTLLLNGCNNEKPAATTAATTAPAADSGAAPAAAGDMAGMDHGPAAVGTDAATATPSSPQLTAMNAMMARMDALKPKGNTDHDFAHMMLEHHRGAVAMADLELRDGRDATMRGMATKIKADQLREIGEMEPIAERLDGAPTNYQPQNAADPFAGKMKAAMADMMKQMPAAVADADMNFNMLMMVHHQSAVDMARAEVAHGKDSQLKAMAQAMIDAQEREIKQFGDWHAKNAGKMKAAATYVCPMGDTAPAAAPGKCPTCGMALEKKA